MTNFGVEVMNSKAQFKRKLRHVVRFVVNVALNRLDFRTAAGNRAGALDLYNNFVRTAPYPKLSFDFFRTLVGFGHFLFFSFGNKCRNY